MHDFGETQQQSHEIGNISPTLEGKKLKLSEVTQGSVWYDG